MNHFRTLHPDYQVKAPHGATVEGETMEKFAANARKIREQTYHGAEIKARARKQRKAQP